MADTVKVWMNFPIKEAALVAEMADARSITRTDVVRRGIVLEKFMQDIVAQKGRIFIERSDGSMQRVVLPWLERRSYPVGMGGV